MRKRPFQNRPWVIGAITAGLIGLLAIIIADRFYENNFLFGAGWTYRELTQGRHGSENNPVLWTLCVAEGRKRALLMAVGGPICFGLLAMMTVGFLTPGLAESFRSRMRLAFWTVAAAGTISLGVGYTIAYPYAPPMPESLSISL